MNAEIAPPGIAPTAANYAHAVLVTQPKSTLHTSGIVPIAADGTVPEPFDQQVEVVWSNLTALLAEAGMGVTDIVNIVTYVVVDQLEHLGTLMAIHDRVLGGHRSASTLITVPTLARPPWKVEISIVAAN